MKSFIRRHPVRAYLLFVVGFTFLTAHPSDAQSTASVSVKVQVPGSMQTSPFNVERYAKVPPNFTLSVYARVSQARFMAVAPNGDLLVSQPSTGKVALVRAGTGGSDPQVSDFVTGLYRPHDIVFHKIGAITYVYIAEADKISRFVYHSGDQTASGREVIISNLPSRSTPELNGSYGHELKNIALDRNHKLYVSIASTCNVCASDTESDPVRAAIYRYNADGTGGRLFAQGLRNAEGLAFIPGTDSLWAVVNNRDNIAYPFHQDYDGDGSDDYGKVMQAYVDNHPPEEMTFVRDGGNYGWPFCNPNPDSPSGYNNMPFDRDVQTNPEGRQLNCATADRIMKGIPAHSAPLGFSFLQQTAFPSAYRNGAVVAYHGSWNRADKIGYKVAYFPWNPTTNLPGEEQELVTGFLSDNGSRWGRPVDAVVARDGSLLISDDYSGTIYQLSYVQEPGVVAAEVGRASAPQRYRQEWHSVRFDHSYRQPVVVTGPLSYQGGQPATVRVRHVTANGFEWKVDEWEYLDGGHTEETISYLVVEAGEHSLPNGGKLYAGVAEVNHQWKKISFAAAGFSGTPALWAQCVSDLGADPVVSRVDQVSAAGAQLRLQESEARDQGHTLEQVAWVAIQTASGSSGEVRWEAKKLSLTHQWATGTSTLTASDPLIFAMPQTARGGDPVGIRYRNLRTNPVSWDLKLEEEQSLDDETGHTPETVNALLFNQPGDWLLSSEQARVARGERAKQPQEEEGSEGEIMQVYPNPARQVLYVQLRVARAARTMLRVTNLMGQTVWEAQQVMNEGHHQVQVPVHRLVPGLYYVTAYTNEREFTKRILIE